MAKIVLGIGSSHSPILLMEPPAWLKRGDTDDRTRFALHDPSGAQVSYDELVKRNAAWTAAEIEPSVLASRHAANEAAIAAVAKALRAAKPDVVILIGDDHKEVFQDDNMPSFSIYWGETFPYKPQGLMKWKYAEDLKADVWYPQEEKNYPVASQLAQRLIGDLLARGFDPSHSKFYRDDQGMSHSFGYVYHRIMADQPLPVIPISLNTYYPPNQITPRRSYQLGRAVREAVEDWPRGIRVAVMATGGLSHFVVDEGFDKEFIRLLGRGEGEEAHATLPLEKLQSGSSEIRCWSALAGAVEGMAFNLINYVPCYRSLAGTGCGMAFATWSERA